MQTINCTINTIAEALRANGLQTIARMLIDAVRHRFASFCDAFARGLYGQAGVGSALPMRDPSLRLPASESVCSKPVYLAVPNYRDHRSGWTGWSVAGRPGVVSTG